MARKTTAAVPAADPAAEAAGLTFAGVWDSIPPGSRAGKGVYSIYKTPDAGMHIAYRPDGADDDQHLEVPGRMMAMMIAASEGKGPLGRIGAMFGG